MGGYRRTSSNVNAFLNDTHGLCSGVTKRIIQQASLPMDNHERSLAACCCAFLPQTVRGLQIYEYKDAAGRTVYTDQPPPSGAVKVAPLQRKTASEKGQILPGPVRLFPRRLSIRNLEFRSAKRRRRSKPTNRTRRLRTSCRKEK